MGKDMKIVVVIVYDSMSNDDDSTRASALDNQPEDSEHIKDFDDNIIDETQGKSAEVEVNPDDYDNLNIGEVIYIM